MARYALVAGDKVERIIITDRIGSIVGKRLRDRVFECPPEVEVGWHLDGTTFAPPTPDELASKAQAEESADRRDRLLDIVDKLVDVLEANGLIDQVDIAAIWEAGK